MRPVLPVLLLLTSCASGPRAPREVVFRGACDASGAVPLSERQMAVADDEDNVLRLYDADRGGPALGGTDVSGPLNLPLKGKKHPKPRELDLEAATRLGDRAYWITSHGRNSKGEVAAERLRLFATTLGEDGELKLVGTPYEHLIDDLLAAPELASFDLATAATLAPKTPGGLNLEGLTALPDGRVLIAFRSPLPGGRALIVPIENLPALVDGGGPARFGAPILLDLGGRGVRSLSWWRGRILLIAGHTASGGASALYTWDGSSDRPQPVDVSLATYNPEGFFTPEDRDEILLLSDDGERALGGIACKKLKDATQRQFRGLWLRVP